MADTNGTGETEVIKLDRLGRSRYTPEYRDQVVDAFKSSGMTIRAYAQQCGVKYQTFAMWLQKRKKSTSTGSEAPPHFVLAEMAPKDVEGLKVLLPGGAIVQASSREQLGLLVELLKALQSKQC